MGNDPPGFLLVIVAYCHDEYGGFRKSLVLWRGAQKVYHDLPPRLAMFFGVPWGRSRTARYPRRFHKEAETYMQVSTFEFQERMRLVRLDLP